VIRQAIHYIVKQSENDPTDMIEKVIGEQVGGD
jgi:hypothetical protein